MIYIIGNCLLVLLLLCIFMFLFMDLTESKYLIEEKDLEQLEKEVKSVLSEDIEGRRS